MENTDVSLPKDKQYAVTDKGVQLALTVEEYDEMNKLHNYILEIMLAVDKFCRENNITYYLGEGTLLGAVRDGGFIPWDDDADIVMLREDYERFLELAADGLEDGYQLDCLATNPKHWSIPSTIQITRHTEFEKEMFRGIALNCGPNIDIFPLDYTPSDVNLDLRIRGKIIRTLKRSLWIKTGLHTKSKYKSLKRKFAYYYPCRLISAFSSIKSLHKAINKLMLKTSDAKNEYLINFASLYHVSKETFKKEWYGNPIEIEFEGHKFYAPSDSDKVLKTLYKDYMKMPPVEKRKSKHHFNNFE
ncbi:MAG: LicD family protein [Acetobacter sp.]|nr:LicD family protein [Bacteroides sp.]MCM1341248.1 LicD family protein [Acetobacter sp.]MCM1433891.1 LicD family protein [Clostridiales bacterium]